MRHKHADAIIAWANGAVVQIKMNRNSPWQSNDFPRWDEEYEYRASLAIVEGKPVFEGDVLNANGRMLPVISINGDIFTFDAGNDGYRCYPHKDYVSWNPPKPATITVTIPRPNYLVAVNSSERVVINGDAFAIANAINEAMK